MSTSSTFLHLTNVALSSDGKDTGACSLKIQVGGEELQLVLGTLGRAIGVYQYPLDIVIDGSAKFFNTGKTALHVVGYQTISHGDFDGEDEMEEDEDDDGDDVPMGVRMNGGKRRSLAAQMAGLDEESDEDEDEDFDEDEEEEGETGEGEGEDGIPAFEDLDPDDEVRTAAASDDEGEDDEGDEGESGDEDAPLNAAELVARQKANKKLLAPMSREMFADEDPGKVHMDEDEGSDDEGEEDGEDDEGEDDEDGEDEAEPSPPPKKASKRPAPSTPAAAEPPSKKAVKVEQGAKQENGKKQAAPAAAAAATPVKEEAKEPRKEKKEKKNAEAKAAVAAASGGPTPVKGIAEPKDAAEYQNAICAFVSKNGGKANLSAIGSAIKRPSSVPKAGAFIKALPKVFKINDATQEISLA
ncbi:MAG: hypothetical protein WDW36_000621 [Sanguina aurantia]